MISTPPNFGGSRNRRSNVACVVQIEIELFVFFSVINLVFVIAIDIWMMASTTFGHRRQQQNMRQTFFWFSLVCFGALSCTDCHRFHSRRRTCDKCAQFRTFVITYLSPSYFSFADEKREKELYDTESHTMETKIDLLKDWTERLDIRGTWNGKLRGWGVGWPCRKSKTIIAFDDAISQNEDNEKKSQLSAAMVSDDGRLRPNIANILFSGRCIAIRNVSINKFELWCEMRRQNGFWTEKNTENDRCDVLCQPNSKLGKHFRGI